MSQPANEERPPFASPEGQPPADRQPPPHQSLYGQPPGAPPPGYGQPYGAAPPYGQGPYNGQWGYGPPGNPGQPRTHPVGDDTTWALFCYIGTIVAGFLAPLVIYFVKRNESAFIRHHAAQSLNYGLTVWLHLLIALALVLPIVIVTESPIALVGFAPVFVFHVIAQYVFLILGTIKASKGEMYRFPTWTCWRMIR